MPLLKLREAFLFTAVMLIAVTGADAAYDHGGADTDSAEFITVYADKAGTKLDSCALCHASGQYEKKPGKWVTLGSCQWCHYAYGYDSSGDIEETLNAYGKDYRDSGRSTAAIEAIDTLDSDGDGFTNSEEIAALRFPGNAEDDPTKVTAPYRVYTLDELESLPRHTQLMLMNTHKSGDFYTQYSGVTVADLLVHAGMLPTASAINVYAPDGWSQYHPLEEEPAPLFYHVFGIYPQARFYYDEDADVALNPSYGWCDYSSPACTGLPNGDPIQTENGLQMLLAFLRDNQYLIPGVLNEENKLDGEGPFRVVPPQKVPGPPDQSSTYEGNDNIIWPFDASADHNAGYATRSATMIRVDPLPDGTTDIDTLEAGWNYVDEGKIVVYGAVDPLPNILEKLGALRVLLKGEDDASFKHRILKRIIIFKLRIIEWMIHKEAYDAALSSIERGLLAKTDGCINNGAPDRNDWITDCELQTQTYWAIHELSVLLKIIN
ncbi:MAG: hypothetical protein PVH87_26310 [Desulfobacteraceae bacterium]|jgi:hypothetical protein